MYGSTIPWYFRDLDINSIASQAKTKEKTTDDFSILPFLSERNTNASGSPNTSHRYRDKKVVQNLRPATIELIHNELDSKWKQQLDQFVEILHEYLPKVLIPFVMNYSDIIPRELYSGFTSILETENRYEAKCYKFDGNPSIPNPHAATETPVQGIIVSRLHNDFNAKNSTTQLFQVVQFFRSPFTQEEEGSFTVAISGSRNRRGVVRRYETNTIMFCLIQGRWTHEISNNTYWIIDRLHTEILLKDEYEINYLT
jgi:hypothetical protein